MSAFIGTYSHIAIDSIMHSDVLPLAPLSRATPWHGIISIETLHVVCLAAAVLGGILYAAAGWYRLKK